MENILDRLIEENRHLVQHGKIADYIPALSNANPNDIGICIMDIKGNIYCSGDYTKKFTIQSISKVISLMLAIMDRGKDRVFQKVGMEPTNEPFNSFYKLELDEEGKPSNPMINAGAIVITSLIKGRGDEKIARLLNIIRDITQDESISYNKEVYLSEKHTGNRNRAMAYLLKDKGLIEGEAEEILDAYFKQCSIEIHCVHLARIGAFFANNCRTPNGDISYPGEIANIITAIMTTCGMYDFSGQYAVEVGIPSKSGVAGGILGIVPNKYGIGVYGPALDKYGNSIAGYGILKGLSQDLNLSIFI